MLWRRPIIKWQLRSVKENSEEDHKEGPKDKEYLKVSHKEGQKEGQKEDPKDKEEGMKNTQSQDLKVKPTDVIFVTMGSTLYKTKLHKNNLFLCPNCENSSITSIQTKEMFAWNEELQKKT